MTRHSELEILLTCFLQDDMMLRVFNYNTLEKVSFMSLSTDIILFLLTCFERDGVTLHLFARFMALRLTPTTSALLLCILRNPML